YLAEAQAKQPGVISTEQVFTDVRRQLIAWAEVLTPEATLALLQGKVTAQQLQERLRELLAEVWTPRWLKAPGRKAPPKQQPPKQYIKGGHTSVYRLLHQVRSAEIERKTG